MRGKIQRPPVWSSPLPVKIEKNLIVFAVHVSQDIFKIYYTWSLFLVFNHSSSLYEILTEVIIVLMLLEYINEMYLCVAISTTNLFAQLDRQSVCWFKHRHPCFRFSPPNMKWYTKYFSFMHCIFLICSCLEWCWAHMFFQAGGTSGSFDSYLTTIKNSYKQGKLWAGHRKEARKAHTLQTPITLSKEELTGKWWKKS